MANQESKEVVRLPEVNLPHWKKLFVESSIPNALQPLKEISKNLWWCWNEEAINLFEEIDHEIWKECNKNPIALLEAVSYQRFSELVDSETFMHRMHRVYNSYKEYLQERVSPVGPRIAYFSMEYGLHDSLKIFSGGLGVLAGDFMKEASDSNVNIVSVGLLYRYGYFRQTISSNGDQIANYEAERFSKVPVSPVFDKDGNWLVVYVEFPGRNVAIRVWRAEIGSISLYLLDTDFEQNDEKDCSITHSLYGGDKEHRLKQEIVLGMGGIKVLEKLSESIDVYHCNEGHAAFIGIERILNLVANDGLSASEAMEVVKSSTLFTTHTPVPAGHDSFHEGLVGNYLGYVPERIGTTWEDFVLLGKAKHNEDHFNMSYLASHISKAINGVSKLHGDVSKNILKELYPGFVEDELEIGYVTNGVHYPTWIADEWRAIHKMHFDAEMSSSDQLNFNLWERIYNVPDEDVWRVKQGLKLKMVNFIRNKYSDIWLKRHENPSYITEVFSNFNPNALTIGFARRFATYKRAHLLFKNLEKLNALINNPNRPVQFLFAGKAHPSDKPGQDLIKHIVEISKRPEFVGKILFLQNYDMELGKQLVQGVDVWMNTPTRPLEASGTSGEKAAMNGTMHFSVLDGWWCEGYREDAGWALSQERSYDVQELQDNLDAETIYEIFNKEIVPAYYDRDLKGVPARWVKYIKNTIGKVAPNFTSARMMHDYQEKYYKTLGEFTASVCQNNYKNAKEAAAWKIRVCKTWDKISVKELQLADGLTNVLKIGESHIAKVVLNIADLEPSDIGVEMIILEDNDEKKSDLSDKKMFELSDFSNGEATFKLEFKIDNPGSYSYGIRLFPVNKYVASVQDFGLIKWLT
ncbi:MAG: alpha-glucan family phosphorylase [Bacteroidales bacterium]